MAVELESHRSSFVVSMDEYQALRGRARKLGMTVPGLAGLILKAYLAEDFTLDFKVTANHK